MAAELAIIAKLQDEASSGIRSLRGEVEGLGDSGGIAAKGFETLQTVGTAALAALAAAAVAVGGAIASSIGVAAEFQDSVTILAIAAKGAGESFDSMRAAAMAVGADTSLVGVNASQAAEAMTTLYKAGMTTGEIFGDLNGYLAGNVELSGALRAAIDGAAASELSMDQAAMLAATSLATFGGEMTTTEQRAQFVNAAMNNFVQAADASMASVADLAAAMANIGPTAAQFGFSLQDTNTALAILSTRGIMGAEAGTALKSMFNNLMQDTPKTTAALNELGVSLYNTDGTMRSMPAIIGDLSQALYGMNEVTAVTGGRTAEQNHQLELAKKSYDQATDAIYKHNAGLKTLTDAQLQKYVAQQSAANAEIERLSAITGTATTAVRQMTEEQRNQYIQTLAGSYGMKAMAVLLMEGTDGWTAMEKAIASAATIQEVAAARTATFSGAMEALTGVVETIQIGIGSAFLPVLTSLAKVLADMAAGALPYIVGAFEALGGALSMFFDAVMAGTNPVTAFADAVAHLAEALGMPAEQAALLKMQIEGVLTTIAAIAGPIVAAITSFVSWKDILALLAIAIASVVIPALLGIVQFVAPIALAIAGLIAVTAALRNAWEADFLGIRSAVEGVVETIQRFVGAFQDSFRDSGDVIGALVVAFQNLVGPTSAMGQIFLQLGEAVRAGVEAVQAFIQALRDGGSLADAFRAGLDTLKQAIFDWAGTTNWGEIGSMILDKIAEAFSSLGDRAATAAASILNWITTAVNSIDWNAVGSAIVNGIAAAIAAATGLLVTAGTAIAGFLNGFFTNDTLAVAGTGLVAALSNAISGAAAGIAGGLETIRQAIFTWAGADSWGEVGSVILDRIASAFSNLGDRVATAAAGILNWISLAVNSIDWNGVGNAIVTGIATAIAAAVGLLVAAGTAIANFFNGFFTNESLAQAGTNIVTSIGNAISGAASGIATGLASIQQAIFDWAGADSWGEVGSTIIDRIAEAFRNLGDRVAEVEAGILNWIADAVNGIDWHGVGETIINGIVAAITAVVGLLVAAGTAIVNYFIGFFTNDEIGPAGENIITALGNAIADFAGGIVDGLAAVQEAIFDWAGAEDWSGVAEKILEMVGEALVDGAEALGDQLVAWRDAIFDWAGAEDWTGVAQTIVEMVGQALIDDATALWDSLESWEQAIFDWAEATNWVEVGLAIATKVGEAMIDAVGLIVEKLVEWQDAIFDWAEATNWIEVGQTIVEMAVEGLTEWADAAADKVDEWFGAMSDTISGIDWYQIGYDISRFVVEGLVEFATTVGETIQGWYDSIKTFMEGKTWDQIALLVIGAIVLGLKNFSEEADGVVSTWKDEIGAKITGMLGAFAELGGNIIGGIISGLEAAASALYDAISGIIAGALGAGQTQAGAHSPATAFMPLGRDISAGVAVGITQGASETVAAIQTLASQVELEGVKAFGEAMKAIAEGVASAMSAILDIGSFQGAGEGFGAALGSIVDLMKSMVSAIASANTYSAEVLENLGAFVEVAGDIGDLLTDTGEIVDTIGRWRAPDLAAVNGSIELLVGFLGEMVRGVLSLVDESTLVLSVLGDFLDSAGQLPELFMGVADITSYLAGWRAPNLEPVVGNINTLAGVLGVLVDAIARTNTMGLGMLEILATFTDTAAGVVALIAPLADAMRDIATFPAGAELGVMQRGIDTMVFYLTQIVTAVAGANVWGQMALENLGTFVEAAGDIVGLIGPMAEAMFGIANFPQGTDVQVMARNIEVMAGYLHDLVAAITESNTWGQLSLDLLGTFVDVAGSIAELITPLAEAIWNIANFQAPDLMAFIGNLSTIANRLSEMVAWFNSGVNYSAAALDALGQYIEVMTDIAEGMTAFIDAIAAIAAFEPPDLLSFIGNVATLAGHLSEMVAWFNNGVNLSQAALEALGQYIEVMTDIAEGVASFVDAVAAIVAFEPPDLFVFQQAAATLAGQIGELVIWFYAGLNLSQAALEALGQYVEVVGDLVDLIADAIEALGLIAAYSSDTAALGPAIAAFARDLMTVVETLVTGFNSASASARTAILAAGDFADAVGDILGVVEDGVDALVALAGYVSVSGIGVAAQQFAVDLAAVITAIVSGLQQAGILASAAVVAAGDLADGLGDLLGMVEDGVDAVMALATYVPSSGIGALAQQFAVDLAAVIAAIIGGLQQAGILASAAVVEAGELADGLGDILGVVADGVEAITALAAYVPAAGIGAAAQQFATDLAVVITTIVNGLQQAGILASAAVVAAGDLAGKLGDLLGVVAGGIEAIKALAEYQGVEGLGEKVQKFTSDLVAVATILATQLTAAANAIGTGTIDAARAFATAVAGLATEVQAAVQGLGQLAGMATPDVNGVLNYIVSTSDQIRTAFSTAGDIGQAVAYAAAFRANLTQLVAEVQGAVQQLNALAGTGTSGTIGAALANIAASLMNTQGQFTGSGTALANALIAAMTAGINGGQGGVVLATQAVIGTAEASGENAAREFEKVGRAITDATVDGVQSGQAQVVAAVVAVVAAAINAGLAEARRAAEVGREVIQAALAEVNAGRGALDTAGSAAGNAIIDGMVRAIANGKSRLVNAIRDAVNAAVAAARAALGIASPSKVADAIMSNFMGTAAHTILGMGHDVAEAMTRAMRLAAVSAEAGLGTASMRPSVVVPTTDSMAGRMAAMPAGRSPMQLAAAGSGTHNQVVIYGDLVLPGVSDTRSLLEELDALRGGVS